MFYYLSNIFATHGMFGHSHVTGLDQSSASEIFYGSYIKIKRRMTYKNAEVSSFFLAG